MHGEPREWTSYLREFSCLVGFKGTVSYLAACASDPVAAMAQITAKINEALEKES